jgi:Histidine kinase
LSFWISYYAYTVFTYIPEISLKAFNDPSLYSNSFHHALNFLPVFIFSVYFSVYFILPKYQQRKGKSFLAVSFLFLFISTMAAFYITTRLIFMKDNQPWDELDIIDEASTLFAGQQIIVTGSAIILKLMKEYALSQNASKILSLEKTRNNLRLFQMQMQPLVLFNCLDAIYHDIDEGTGNAPQMILKLADLLSYLIYEGDLPTIGLNKEIAMTENYIDLKNLELKNKFRFDFQISCSPDSYYIMPGLLLPLLDIITMPFVDAEQQLVILISLTKTANNLYFILENNNDGSRILKMPLVKSTIESVRERIRVFHLYGNQIETVATSDSLKIIVKMEIAYYPIQSKILNSGKYDAYANS